MTSPNSTVASPIDSEPNDQWSLVWKNFRKRRLAVAGMILISLLILTSIFAPFLANGKPLWYRGYNRFQYQDAHRTLSILASRFGTADQADSKADSKEEKESDSSSGTSLDLPGTMRIQVGIMRKSLATDRGTELAQKVEELIAKPVAERAKGANEFRTLLRGEYHARKTEFVSRTSSPVLESLIWADIFCMTVAVVLLLIPLWNRFLPKTRSISGKSRATRLRFAIILGLPALCAFAWWLTVPERLDRTPYDKAVLVSADKSEVQSAPVVYESVVRAPIPYDLDANDLDRKYSSPSWGHLLGTDDVGRDVMSRMIWGGRVSLAVGLVAVSINVIIGVVVGAIAGYFRGVADLFISRIIEIVICFPSFFLILTIVAFIGPSIFNIMIVLGLIGWTTIAQLVRGEFLRLGEQEFILAARALGFSPARIIFLHVLPNAMAPVLVSATFGIAGAILTESALSFL
ncbi:MAG: ABC transporter permease, partial [Planctomycetaceae bacterium]|nr:ABC transporter permease [Planctomycetaceae bacterium]